MVLDDAAVRSLARLQAAFKLKSKADVYELAVRVLTWTTEQQVEDFEVGRYKNGEFQPLLLPFDIDSQAWRAAK